MNQVNNLRRKYQFINLRSQEIRVLLSGDLAGEILRRQLILITSGSFGCKLVRLLLKQFACISLVNFLTFGCRHAVPTPLPKLAAAYFCRCSIFLEFNQLSGSLYVGFRVDLP